MMQSYLGNRRHGHWMAVALLFGAMSFGSSAAADAQSPSSRNAGSVDFAGLLQPPSAVIDGMTFPSEGSSGVSIERTHYAGPMFTLSQTTLLTEVGAFINHYVGSHTMRVVIVKAVNGVPDVSRVYGVFTLSSNPDFYRYRYEAALMALILRPGAYFALFATDGDDRATILGSSGTFQADVFVTGAVDSTGTVPPHAIGQYLAVTIFGKPLGF